MRHYRTTDKKVYLYPITDQERLLDLMNIVTYKDGMLDSVNTYIGRHDRDEFLLVQRIEDLAYPGAFFRYSEYLKKQEMMLPFLVQTYHEKLKKEKEKVN